MNKFTDDIFLEDILKLEKSLKENPKQDKYLFTGEEMLKQAKELLKEDKYFKYKFLDDGEKIIIQAYINNYSFEEQLSSNEILKFEYINKNLINLNSNTLYDNYELIVTSNAENDLLEFYDYIKKDLNNKEGSIELRNKINELFKLIQNDPYKNPIAKTVKETINEYRFLCYECFYVIYYINKNKVYISNFLLHCCLDSLHFRYSKVKEHIEYCNYLIEMLNEINPK